MRTLKVHPIIEPHITVTRMVSLRKLILIQCGAAVFALGLRIWAQGAGQEPELRPAVAEVELPLGEKETKTDLMNRARNQARAEALANANGVRIDSMTAVNNGKVLLDLVNASARGILVNETFTELPPSDSFRYRVKFEGKALPPRQIHLDPSFTVKVAVDQDGVFRPGDLMHLTIRSTADASIHVFNVFADGSVTVLIPNRYHTDKTIRANTDLVFPSPAEEQQGIKLKAALLPNQKDASESIVVIATKEPVDLVGSDFKEAILKEFDASNTGGITQLALKLLRLGDAAWTQSVETYRIVGVR